MKKLLLASMCLLGASALASASAVFRYMEDPTKLKAGDKFVFVAKKTNGDYVAMGDYTKVGTAWGYFAPVPVTVEGGCIDASNNDLDVITVEDSGNAEYPYLFKTWEGYVRDSGYNNFVYVSEAEPDSKTNFKIDTTSAEVDGATVYTSWVSVQSASRTFCYYVDYAGVDKIVMSISGLNTPLDVYLLEGEETPETSCKLVEDVTTLAAGDELVIVYVNGASSKAMGAQNGTYRNPVDVTVKDNEIDVATLPESVAIVTLEESGNADYPWLLKAEDGYLYHTGTSNSISVVSDTTGVSGYDWKISGTEVVCNAKNGTKDYELQYNTSSPRFTCYTGSQKDVNVFRYINIKAVATPVITLVEGDSSFSVEMSCATKGAKIYYTTDGSTPTEESELYTGPIVVTEETTFKAIAYTAAGDSRVATLTATPSLILTNVAGLAELESGSAVIVKTAMTAVYQYGSYLYVKDENNDYILVYGSLGQTLANGDTFGRLAGVYSPYNNLPELTKPEAITDVTAGTPVQPEVVTLADITLENVSHYFAINKVNIEGDNLVDEEGNTVALYDQLKTGVEIKDGEVRTIEGFVGVYKETIQFYPIAITYADEAKAECEVAWINSITGEAVTELTYILEEEVAPVEIAGLSTDDYEVVSSNPEVAIWEDGEIVMLDLGTVEFTVSVPETYFYAAGEATFVLNVVTLSPEVDEFTVEYYNTSDWGTYSEGSTVTWLTTDNSHLIATSAVSPSITYPYINAYDRQLCINPDNILTVCAPEGYMYLGLAIEYNTVGNVAPLINGERLDGWGEYDFEVPVQSFTITSSEAGRSVQLASVTFFASKIVTSFDDDDDDDDIVTIDFSNAANEVNYKDNASFGWVSEDGNYTFATTAASNNADECAAVADGYLTLDGNYGQTVTVNAPADYLFSSVDVYFDESASYCAPLFNGEKGLEIVFDEPVATMVIAPSVSTMSTRIERINLTLEKKQTGVESVAAEAAEAVYYNLQGVRVDNPENGLYIRVRGTETSKVVIR